jgi:hypothetical protein
MKKEKIEKFSKATGKEITTIKMALGIPVEPCKGNTLKEVEKIATSSKGEAYIVALRKWRDLSLELAKRAKTSAEAWKVYEDSVEHSEGADVAFQKWEKLYVSEIKKMTTFEEIYGDTGCYGKGLETKSAAVRRASMKRASELCLQKLKKATTFEEAQKLLRFAPSFTKTGDAILRKMYKFFK